MGISDSPFITDPCRCILHGICLIALWFNPANGQCPGTAVVYTAVDDYQVFTSLNYPFGYGNDQNCVWRIEADNVTDAILLEVTDASIEYHADCVYDYGEVFDGYNASAASLGKFCGTANPSFVSNNNYMTVTFVSDYSLYSKGFKARYKSGPRWTLVDGNEKDETFSMLAILGVSIGAVVIILVVTVLVYTYIQAKKAKEMRRHTHRGVSRTRVHSYDSSPWNLFSGTAPPAYGEINSSPMSPPPTYSEVDPNPSTFVPMPGRVVYMSRPTPPGTQANLRADNNANTHFVLSNNFLRPSVHRTVHNVPNRIAQSPTFYVSSSNSLLTLSPAALQNQSNSTGSVVTSSHTTAIASLSPANPAVPSDRNRDPTNLVLHSQASSVDVMDRGFESAVSTISLSSTYSTAFASRGENITPVN